MLGAVTQPGYLGGVGVAEEVAVGAPPPAGLEKVVDPRAKQAGRLQAEQVGEPGDQIREQTVEEEEGD